LRRLASAYREAYSGLPRTTWWVAVVALVNRSGTMVLPFLALYLTSRRGFDAAQAGLLLGLYGLGSAGGTYLGGELCDRLGALPLLRFSLICSAAGFLLISVLESPLWIGASLLFVALLGDAARPALSTLVIAGCPRALRTRAFALLRLSINVGMAIGPVLGGFLALVGYVWLFVVDALTCLLAAALAFSFLKTSPVAAVEAESKQPAGPGPFRDGPFLIVMLLLLVNGMIFLQMFGTLPLYWRERQGFLENEIGLLFALNPVIIVVFEMVLVHRLANRNPVRLMGLGVILIGLGFGLIPFGDGASFALLTVLIWTLGEMLESPQTGGFVVNRAGDHNRGRYLGVYLLTFSLALLLAPIAGTSIYQHLGPNILWWTCGASGLLSGSLLLFLSPKLHP